MNNQVYVQGYLKSWPELRMRDTENQMGETFHCECTNHVVWAKHLAEFAAC